MSKNFDCNFIVIKKLYYAVITGNYGQIVIIHTHHSLVVYKNSVFTP